MRIFLTVGLVVVLSACSITEPVVVIGPGGLTLKGTARATMSGGSFFATDGKLTCSGNYNSMSMEPTISMQTLCSDGRKGIVIVTRESSGTAGHGTVRLNDGSEWTLIFGAAAANF